MVSDHLAGGEVGEVGREDLCSALGNLGTADGHGGSSIHKISAAEAPWSVTTLPAAKSAR